MASVMLYRQSLDTPVGPMVAVASPGGLCGLEFVKPERLASFEARLRARFRGATTRHENAPAIDAARRWLVRYFEDPVTASVDTFDALGLVLDLIGTPFECNVWTMLLEIPLGGTSQYGVLASRLGLPNGARAVGGAVGSNPISIIVPCHRVVGADGSLTGYGGGLPIKQWLLAHEGVLRSATDTRVLTNVARRDENLSFFS
jgi:methylated-DNA-[protein]-cysteine S-methyltransferase